MGFPKGTRLKEYCLNGHARVPENIEKGNRTCKICARAAAKRRRDANAKPKVIPTHCKNGHLRTPESWRKVCLICKRELERATRLIPEGRIRRHAIERHYRKTKRVNVLAAQRKIKYGLDLTTYCDFLVDQENRCAICREAFDDGTWKNHACVDHDHVTGRIRGLLCRTCNSGIGHLKDDIGLMLAAIRYIKNPPADEIMPVQPNAYLYADNPEVRRSEDLSITTLFSELPVTGAIQ